MRVLRLEKGQDCGSGALADCIRAVFYNRPWCRAGILDKYVCLSCMSVSLWLEDKGSACLIILR